MHRGLSLPLIALALVLGACGEGGDVVQVDVQYQEESQRVNVLLSREVASGESLYARLRFGQVGELDCAADHPGIDRIDGNRVGSAPDPTYEGPTMTPEDFETPYNDPTWLDQDPTPEMLAAIADGRAIIDVCLMNGADVVAQEELDARRALDRRGGNGKFDGPEARIASTVAYAQSCIDELGEIPFFPRLNDVTENDDGSPGPADYGTWNCLDSTPIPTTVTAPDGTVTYPTESVSQCDNPQYIYSSCEPSAVGANGEERPDVNGPRVTSATNDRGTSWVLLCRKAKSQVGEYNDIAMIGSNPYTGQTCFFQNALYSRTDGLHVPHPADTMNSEESPQTNASLWEGIQGGVAGPGGTSNIECGDCHSTDAFIHSPWIDGALDENGDTVVPRMGQHPDFALGYNNSPYYIHNTEGQGWIQPRHITAPEAGACTSCHRIGLDVWSRGRRGSPWIDRLVGEDSAWLGITTDHYNEFDQQFWMPDGLDGVDRESWPESEYGQAVAFIQACGQTPDDPACGWEEIPRAADGDEGTLPTVDLTGSELATAALTALGADLDGMGGTRRCAECHAISRFGIREWLEDTEYAWNTCGLTEGRDDLEQLLLDFVNSAEQSVLDDDVELRSDTTQNIVDARPFSSLEELDAVSGVGPATLARLQEYASGETTISAEDARRTIDCLRADRDDPESVFAAEHVGILATGVQYGYFRRLFQTAYGDTWPVEYGRFKARVQMPKGSHRLMSQEEYATLLAWFRNGLNNLDDVLPEPPPPETCTPAVDTAAMSTHLSNMQFEGWQAVNEDMGIRMFGCTDAADPSTCFTDTGTYPDRSADWGNGFGRVVQVHELDFSTSFWMRSSADGRFVGNGGSSDQGGGATITDLQAVRNIGVRASYDPGFFPDNSGFIFQGATGGAGFCVQSVLEGSDDLIDFSETGCNNVRGINLYQHVARGINGGDYWVINSQFTSDSGKSASSNPRAPWNASSTMKFTPMIFDGTTYQAEEAVIVESPFEGDSVLSPSGLLVSSRIAGPDGRMLGYNVRQVNAIRGSSGYRITLSDPVSTICSEGAKVNFSFDERYMVTHNHNDHQIHLMDLMDGTDRQVTNFPAGWRGLFPHFLSNGWVYFLVLDPDGNHYVGAADAATL